MMYITRAEGHTLLRRDGTMQNRIRHDLVPSGTRVVVEGGRHFVFTGERDDQNFWVYMEGHLTYVYNSDAERAEPVVKVHATDQLLAELERCWPVEMAEARRRLTEQASTPEGDIA